MPDRRSKIIKFTLASSLFFVALFAPIALSAPKPEITATSAIKLKIQTAKAYTPGDPSLVTNVLAQNQEVMRDKRTNGAWVKQLYDYCRGMLNVVLLVFLIYIAFMNILNRDMNNYAIKAILPKIIGVALFANVALPLFAIISRIIDSVQTLSLFKPIGFDWDYIVGAGASPAQNGGVWGLIAIIGIVVAGGISGIGCLIGGAIIFGAIIVVILLNLILAFRPYVVFLSVAIAPLALGCFILPQTKTFFDRWVKIVVPWLIMPLPVFFIINMGLRIPSNMGLVGDGPVSSILGFFLPALLRAGLLILAIRFPFTVEKDITTGIQKLGGLTAGMTKSAIGGMSAWEDQALWPKKWKNSQNAAKRLVGSMAVGTSKFVNRPVTTAAEWTARAGGGTAQEVKDRIARYQNTAGVKIVASWIPSMVRLTAIPETIKEKRERNAGWIQDALDENSQVSAMWEDEVTRTKRLKEAYKEREEDKEYEVLVTDIEDTLTQETEPGVRRDDFMFSRFGNLGTNQLASYYSKTMLKDIFDQEYARQEAANNALPPDQRQNRRELGASVRASVDAQMDAERTRVRGLAQQGRDALIQDMGTQSVDLQRRMVDAFIDEMATTSSNGKLTMGGEAVGYGGLSKADFDLLIARARTLKRKSGRQTEPVGFDDIRGGTRSEAYQARERRSFAGGYDGEEEGKVGGDTRTDKEGAKTESKGTTSTQTVKINPGDVQTDLGQISAQTDIGALINRLPRGDMNLSIVTIRRLAREMAREGGLGSSPEDSTVSATQFASRLEDIMSPERFAAFGGAMARGDDVTVTQILQSAPKGEERDLIQASISAKEISSARAQESGETQNVAVYATRIAPQFATIRNDQQKIEQLKQSAETIIADDNNAAFNATRPPGAGLRETLTPVAIAPHKRAIAQMIGTSVDTVDGQSAKFFMRAIDALDTANSSSGPAQQTQQVPSGTS